MGENTEKSPEKLSNNKLRILAVSQTPVKYHQLTLVWKTRKENNNFSVQLNGIKYSYLILMIFERIYLTHRMNLNP